MTKVFCSGCFDLLHSGHVAFLDEAASHGDLFVGIASDKTVFDLKGRCPIAPQEERLYMIKALRMVKDAWVNTGNGLLDFVDELNQLRPDCFFVNEDGHNVAKKELCENLGVKYVVSKRMPHTGLPVRSTTAFRAECTIPYRLDLAGAWLDQPVVSRLYPGSVLTISIEPDYEFNDLSGMATSTRKKAIELWQTRLPEGDRMALANTLFCVENPPGRTVVSGSQDALGIVLPGLNRLEYHGDFWPAGVSSILDDDVLSWLEEHLRLVFIKQRTCGFDAYRDSCLTEANAKALADATDVCWDAIRKKDLVGTGKAIKDSFYAQTNLLPSILTREATETIDMYKNDSLGWKLCGAGGGGYLVLWTDGRNDDLMRIRIRRLY